jgi:hypothetical protein
VQGTLKVGLSLPAVFRDIQILSQVLVPSWDSLLTLTCRPALFKDFVPKTHEDVRRALIQHETSLPEVLIDALETVFELGTEPGRDALLEGAVGQGLDLTSEARDVGPPTFALAVWMRAQKETALLVVLDRARLRVERLDARRTTHERAGKTNRRAKPITTASIGARVAAWCRDNGRSEHVDVMLARGPDDLEFEIVRDHLLRTEVERKHGRRRTFDFRPLHADHVRYDADVGRLRIESRSAAMVKVYCTIFGDLLFGDPDFFQSENICTLRPLERDGATVIGSHGIARIQRAAVTEMLWAPSAKATYRIRSDDCFEEAKTRGLRLHEGSILEVRIDLSVVGDGRRTRVKIKVPNVIDVSRRLHEDLVRKFLTVTGIKGHFEDSGRERDLWDVSGLSASEVEWRHAFQDDFEAARKRSFLRPTILRTVSSPDHPDVPHALEVEQVPGGGWYGVSRHDGVQSRALTETDVSGYEFNVRALAESIRDELGLAGSCDEVAQRVWSVGRRDLNKDLPLAVYLLAGEPTKDALSAALSKPASSSKERRVLLIPAGRNVEVAASATAFEYRLPHGPFDALLVQMIDALGLRDQVSKALLIPEGTHLVIDSSGTVTLDDVALSIGAETHAFKFLLELARKPGAGISHAEMMATLSPKSSDPSQVVRNAKHELVKQINASFKAAGLAPPDPIVTVASGSSRLTTSAFVI